MWLGKRKERRGVRRGRIDNLSLLGTEDGGLWAISFNLMFQIVTMAHIFAQKLTCGLQTKIYSDSRVESVPFVARLGKASSLGVGRF